LPVPVAILLHNLSHGPPSPETEIPACIPAPPSTHQMSARWPQSDKSRRGIAAPPGRANAPAIGALGVVANVENLISGRAAFLHQRQRTIAGLLSMAARNP
jgi:hypothetical protein